MINLKSFVNKLFFLPFLAIILVASCSEKDNEANIFEANRSAEIEITQNQINDVFAEIKSLGDSQGKIITFDIKNLTNKNYQKHFKVVQNSKKVMDFTLGFDSSQKDPEDNYTVTCTWGDGKTEVTECGSDVGCAGQATWDCLDLGGCAAICNARITYVPATIIPEKMNKKKAIENVLAQVEEIAGIENSDLSFTIAYNQEKYWLKEYRKVTNHAKKNLNYQARDFQVDCYGSDGELLWSETYASKGDASIGILQCTDEDSGCAEVCEIHARFIFGTSPNK